MGLAEKGLHVADYVVIGIAVCTSLVAGIYHAYKDRHYKTAYQYHRGGGKLKAFPVALSLVVTFESSIFFLGYPAEVYIHGYKFLYYNLAQFLAYSCMLWISIPLFYPLQITSVYEYIEMRYESLPLRRFASILSTVTMTLYAGIVLFGAAVALESVLHISAWVSVIAMVVIAVIYTSLGGLKAVVVTDVIQGVVMIVAIFAILIYGTVTVGGVKKVFELNKPSGRIDMNAFDLSPFKRHTFWTMVVGGATSAIGMVFRQTTVQRLNSTKSIAEARKVAYLSIAGFMILQVLVMTEGIVAYAYFTTKGCDPLASGEISNPNQLISYIVLDMFQSVPGVPGLFLAALCCASLSTISSLLSSTSAVISEDVIKPYWKNVTEEKLTNASKLIVFVFGLLCMGVALLIGQIKGPLSQIAVSMIGAFDAPIIALFLMSVFIKFVTKKGVVAGALVGLLVGMWLSLGYNFSPGRLHTPWLPLGPVDRCETENKTSIDPFVYYGIHDNTFQTSTTNVSFRGTTPPLLDNSQNYSEAIEEETQLQSVHGIDYLYSISYLYIPCMIIIVSISVGLVVSRVTKKDLGKSIPRHLILSFREQFLCCFPKNKKSSVEDPGYEEVVVKHENESQV